MADSIELNWQFPGSAQSASASMEIDAETITVSRIFVPGELRGKGVAGQLAKNIVDMAKGGSKKIAPHCPYMRTYLERHSLMEMITPK